MSTLTIVILAAGNGTRMKSQLPKVLLPLAGKPLLQHILDQAALLQPDKIILVHQKKHLDVLKHHLTISHQTEWVEQHNPTGTADAVACALPLIETDKTLILYGDVPLTPSHLMAELATTCQSAMFLTHIHEQPFGFGRIIRNEHHFIERIVEEKDATKEEQSIQEIFTGIMCIKSDLLFKYLPLINNKNAQKELYLTDLASLCPNSKASICDTQMWISGVNSKPQLVALERAYQRSLAEQLLDEGVHILDPSRIDIHGSLSCGTDTIIEPNVMIKGQVSIGSHCTIETGVVLNNVSIGNGVTIKAHSVVTDSTVGHHVSIGPFAHLRPGNIINDHVKIGNFVEVKQTTMGQGSKASHLAYLGNCTMGQSVNIGAGTITCNYDGLNKHDTLIGDQAFIGCNTAMIAPVVIGQKATIGAGSVITHDADENTLTLSRAKQVSVPGWIRKKDKSQ